MGSQFFEIDPAARAITSRYIGNSIHETANPAISCASTKRKVSILFL